MRKHLTQVAVAKLRFVPGKFASGKSAGKPILRNEIADAGCRGLYLVIESSGSKSFYLRYRDPSDRPRRLRLGAVDAEGTANGEPVVGGPLSLAAAHALAKDLLRKNAAGENIAGDNAEKFVKRRIAAEAAARETFPKAALDYVEWLRKTPLKDGRKHRTWWKIARVLGLDYGNKEPFRDEPRLIAGGLCDIWDDKAVGEITRRDLIEKIHDALRRAIPGREARQGEWSIHRHREMTNALKKFFKYLAQRDRIPIDPASAIEAGNVGKSRERVLSDEELKKVWENGNGIVRLLLLTGQRRSEVAGMRWSELDWQEGAEEATWTLPGDRTKNGREHVVPLVPFAMREIFENHLRGESDFVFEGRTGKTPFSGFGKFTERLYEKCAIKERWTLHDLRRTMVTRMVGDLGVEPHVVEAVINHASGHKSGVAGIYNRARYDEQKKKALLVWSNYVETLVTPKKKSKVASLDEARRSKRRA
jgi:integrase